jgi:hypothetical protein
MYTIYCGERKIFMRGDNLEPLMRRSGFTDIQVRIVKIEVGEWGEGPVK